MRIFIASLVLMLGLLPAAATTYRWVDEQGNVHYSDQPHQGAKQIVVPQAQTYNAPAADAAPNAPPVKPAPPKAVPYTGFAIDSPTPDQVLWNIGATLTVTATLQPGLQQGDSVQFYYDGKPSGDPGTALSITLDKVFRGTHTVSATVIGAHGKVKISTKPVTFYVKQHSILKPH